MAKWEIIEQQNPWWTGQTNDKLDWLEDHYRGGLTRKEIEEKLQPGTVHLLKGPRQIGKTTYLLKLIDVFPEIKTTFKGAALPEGIPYFDSRAILYFSAEALSAYEMANVIQNFFLLHPNYPKYLVCIDEITSIKQIDGSKGWASNLKKLIDSGTFKNSALILTGSDANKLEEGSKVLLGRGIEGNLHHLAPLTFRDFVYAVISNSITLNMLAKNKIQPTDYKSDQMWQKYQEKLRKLNKTIILENALLNNSVKDIYTSYANLSGFTTDLHFMFHQYIKTGGFPESILVTLVDKKKENEAKIYEKTIVAVLEKLELSGLLIETAKKILLWILDAQGQTISYSGIGKDLGLKVTLVEKYLEALEQLHIITLITNEAKTGQRTYLKKAYLTDPLFMHSLRVLRGEQPDTVADKAVSDEKISSKIVESVICNALKQHAYIPRLKETNTFLHFSKASASDRELDFIFTRKNGTKLGIEVKYQETINRGDLHEIDGVDDYLLVTKNTFEHWDENHIALPAHVFLALLDSTDVFL